MTTTFITVLAWLVFGSITAWVGVIFIAFLQLSPWEQKHAKITIGAWPALAWLISLAWIITSFIG